MTTNSTTALQTEIDALHLDLKNEIDWLADQFACTSPSLIREFLEGCDTIKFIKLTLTELEEQLAYQDAEDEADDESEEN